MRFLLICLLFVPVVSYSQSQSDPIFKKVVSAASVNFKEFRSFVKKEYQAFTDYGSLVTIEGTKENYIRQSLAHATYTASIQDSLKFGRGWKLLKRWKKKVEAGLGPGYTLKKRPFLRFNDPDEEFAFENKVTGVSVIISLAHEEWNKWPYNLELRISNGIR